MINLDDLEHRVQEGYSIPPFDGGKQLVDFARGVEMALAAVDWEETQDMHDALADVRAHLTHLDDSL